MFEQPAFRRAVCVLTAATIEHRSQVWLAIEYGETAGWVVFCSRLAEKLAYRAFLFDAPLSPLYSPPCLSLLR
jgi:hypothetical protein